MEGDSEPIEGSQGVDSGTAWAKRPKTLVPSPSKTTNWKGKEKLVDRDDVPKENPSCICGICLTEDGKAARGIINCCDHYFCFVCIMEWANVESRCPMCKKRFETVWRSLQPDSSLKERLVNVPFRDQVVGSGSVDLYANIYCTVCNGSDNESVLLLCDLCDSAAHTYCVGLGAVVPEGDWYCHDCTISKNEHSTTEANCESYTLNSNIHLEGVDLSLEHELISAIVQDEPIDHKPKQNTQRNRTKSSGTARRKTNVKATQDTSQHGVPHTPPPLVSVLGTASFPRSQSTDQGARTLSRCRNLQNRIRSLRENWNALQTGSLSFSSRPFDSLSAMNIKRRNTHVMNNYNDDNEDTNARSVNNEDSCEVSRKIYDVDRAWKMMEAAKSLQTRKNIKRNLSDGTKIKHCDSGVATTNKADSFRESPRNVVENGNHVVGVHANNSATKGSISVKCKLSENGFVNREPVPVCSYALERGCSSSGTLSTIAMVACASEFCKDPDQQLDGSNLLSIRKMNLELDSGSILPVGASNICTDKSKPNLSSTELLDKFPGSNLVEDAFGVEAYRKSHIQSLVKINLKLLTKERKLAPDRFKEIARISTHTILAACGLEHVEYIAHPFRKLHCSHSGNLHTSSLMSHCCRECFNAFTEDVVSTILSKKRLIVQSGTRTGILWVRPD